MKILKSVIKLCTNYIIKNKCENINSLLSYVINSLINNIIIDRRCQVL
jgi:hypothetical protein